MSPPRAPARRNARRTRRVGSSCARLARAVQSRLSSSLTRRIVVLNLGGLVALLIGFLYLNQFREGLIDARVQSLQTQGEIIAAAIAASATVETDAITIDPEKLLQLAPGESYGVERGQPAVDGVLDQSRAHRPAAAPARVADAHARAHLRSRRLSAARFALGDGRSTILRFDLGRPAARQARPAISSSGSTRCGAGRVARELPLYEDIGAGNGRAYPEVARALTGGAQSVVRVNAQGETIISVAVPVQRFRAVRGALLLSTQGGDIDAIIASERWAIIRIFLVSAGVMLLLSLFFAGTIAEPMRRLAEAAERVRRGIKSRQEIPDFSQRQDEIGHLSGALRDMTEALYNRIEAIESFAADVAHELKNPLTSLRSAVETLPIAKDENARARLLDDHQARRAAGSTGSSATFPTPRGSTPSSRAPTWRPSTSSAVLQAVVGIAHERRPRRRRRGLARHPAHRPIARRRWRVLGHDSRLGQVFDNLIDNARSFSAPGGSVRVTLRAERGDRAGRPARRRL